MARWMNILAKALCVFFVLSFVEFDFSDARGGRGGGFRGGFRSSRSSRSYRSSKSTRISRGSSPFTRNTWYAAAFAGSIYGGRRYLRSPRYYRDRNAQPTICTNNYDLSPNRTVYGYFICPRDGEPNDYDYCCGESKRERCCRFEDDPGRIAGIVIGVLVAVGVIGVVVYCCCKRSGAGGKVIRKFSGRKDPPAQPPTMMTTHQQPPAYSDTNYPNGNVGPGYDHSGAAGKGGLPYDLPPDSKPDLPPGNYSSAPYPPNDINGYPAYPPPEGPPPAGFNPPPNPGYGVNPYPAHPPPPYPQ